MVLIAAGLPAIAGPNWDHVPVAYDVDVVVLGGGPSGVAAAIAAARNGAKVLLVEQYSFLGGMGTAAEVNVFMPWANTGGIFQEMLGKLSEVNGRAGAVFDIPTMQMLLDDMTQEAGVHVLYYTRGIAATTAPGKPWNGQATSHITGLVIQNKTGIQLVHAKTYIDCSGDGDLAAFAGAPFEMGRPDDGKPGGSQLPQPMTMIFRVGGCNWKGGDLAQYHPDLAKYWCSTGPGPNPGEITFNATRILNHSGVSGESLSDATILGRREVLTMFRLLREHVPGFEKAYLLALPTQIGVRETRRVIGASSDPKKQVLTGDDVLSGRTRGDVIARCKYDVDIHNPTGEGGQIIRLKAPYDIPYRCLIPRGVDNLLIAGRPISADHVAHSSLRVQPTCYALGQAAGTAAAICVQHQVGPWDLAPYLDDLQKTLIKQGADLGDERARLLGVYPDWRRWQLQYRRNKAALPPGGFSDLPPGHPAREAATELAKLGVFSGVGGGKFGADEPAPAAQLVTVISRVLAATELDTPPAPTKVTLPAALSDEWWSEGLRELAERGVITGDETTAFSPDASDETTLRLWLGRAFPKTGVSLPALPVELQQPGTVSRSAAAYLLWECVKGDIVNP